MITVALGLTVLVSKPLQELMDAERAFSVRCRQIGYKKSFLEFISSDSVNFHPGPGLAKPRLEKEEDDPPGSKGYIKFEWEPVVAGISASQDFGFTSGWLKIYPPDRPVFDGSYFSVWRKEKGVWKMIADLSPQGKFTTPAKVFEAGKPQPPTWPSTLTKLESNWSDSLLDKEAICMPTDPALKVEAKGPRKAAGGEVARSGDLAFTYGTFDVGEAGKNGCYITLWRNQGDGWKVLIDITRKR